MMMFENRAYHFLVVESRQHDRQHAAFSASHHRAARVVDDDDDAFARRPFSNSSSLFPSLERARVFL